MLKRWLTILLALLLVPACGLPGTAALQVLTPLDSIAHDLTFSPDGQMLAFGTLDDGAQLWRVADHTLVASFGEGDIRAIAFAPDGQVLVTGDAGTTSTVRLWSLIDHSLIRTLDPALTAWVQSVDVSPDGSQLAVGTSTQVHLFKVTDGSLLHTFDRPGMDVAFSPDGHQLASAENLPVIRIWDLHTYAEVYTLPGHGFQIAYAADGTYFAAPGWNNLGMATFEGAETFATTAGGENQVQLWNRADGRHLRAVNTHPDQVHSLAFSPDSQWLVSGGNDPTVRLVRVADGKEVASVTVADTVDSVAFSSDGTLVAIGVYQTLYLWSVGELVKQQAPEGS